MVLRHTITHPSRVHTVQFSRRVNGTGDLLLVGAEDKKLSIYDIPDDPDKMPTVVAEMIGHSNRYVAPKNFSVLVHILSLQRKSSRNTPSCVAPVNEGKYSHLDYHRMHRLIRRKNPLIRSRLTAH